MHGRKRVAASEVTPEQKASLATKVATFRKLTALSMSHKSSDALTAESFSLNGSFCALNPACESLWNYRRSMLLRILEAIRKASEPVNMPAALASTTEESGPSLTVGGSNVAVSGTAVEGGEPAASASSSSSRGESSSSSSSGASSAPLLPPGIPSDLTAIIAMELKVTKEALTKNSKTYPAWHHRTWVITQIQAATAVKLGAEAAVLSAIPSQQPGGVNFLNILRGELDLCGTLLSLDERNFHCWNYRTWISRLLEDLRGASAFSDEMEFTESLLRKNFSNYSAWHYRSVLLTREYSGASREAAAAGDGAEADGAADRQGGNSTASAAIEDFRKPLFRPSLPPSILGGEFSLLLKAAFTEPDDQSAWFYHRWLLSCIQHTHLSPESASSSASVSGLSVPVAASGVTDSVYAVLQVLAATAQILELHAAEPTSKWPCLALAYSFKLLSSDASQRILSQVAAFGSASYAVLEGMAEKEGIDPASLLALCTSLTTGEAGRKVAEQFAVAAALDPKRGRCYAEFAEL